MVHGVGVSKCRWTPDMRYLRELPLFAEQHLTNLKLPLDHREDAFNSPDYVPMDGFLTADFTREMVTHRLLVCISMLVLCEHAPSLAQGLLAISLLLQKMVSNISVFVSAVRGILPRFSCVPHDFHTLLSSTSPTLWHVLVIVLSRNFVFKWPGRMAEWLWRVRIM